MLGYSRVYTFLAGINGSQCYEIMYLDLLNAFVMFSFRSCSASIKKTVFSSHKQIYFVGNRASCAVTSITLVYLQWLSSVPVFFLTQIILSIISTLAYNLPSIIIMFLPERKGGARTTQLSPCPILLFTLGCCMVFLKSCRNANKNIHRPKMSLERPHFVMV